MSKRFKGKIRNWRGVMSFMMALLILFYTVIGGVLSNSITVHAEADSVDRVKTFIELAKEQEGTNEVEGVEDLTTDELFFLGVYLSNFYVPYGTELGVDEKSDKYEELITNMSSALNQTLKFDETVSKTLSENIIGLSRSNYKELVFKVSKGYQDGKYYDLKLFPSDGNGSNLEIKNIPVTQYMYTQCMLGNFTDWIRYMDTTDLSRHIYLMDGETGSYWGGIEGCSEQGSTECMTAGHNHTMKYGYFGFEEDGVFHPVSDCYLSTEFNEKTGKTIVNETVSQNVFKRCLNTVNYDKGYGTSLFDLTEDEVKTDTLSSLSSTELNSFTSTAAPVLVDCFGNIIYKGAAHQYIAVPGCLNPYTWVVLNTDGTDLYGDGLSAGRAFPALTFAGLSAMEDETLIDGKSTNAQVGGGVAGAATKAIGDSTVNSYKIKSSHLLKGLKKDNYYNIDKGYIFRGMTTEDNKQFALFKNHITDKYKNILKLKDSEYKSYLQDLHKDVMLNIYKYPEEITKDYKEKTFGTVSNAPISKGSTHEVLDNFFVIDNIGAFQVEDFESLKVIHYLKTDGTIEKPLPIGKEKNIFVNKLDEIKSGQFAEYAPEETTILSLYTTYAIAGLYEDSKKEETVAKLRYRMNRGGLPAIESSPINFELSAEDLEDMQLKDIKNWIWYWLNPSEGLNYLKVWVKNKLTAVLVGWHHDILGTNNTGATTGVSYYRSTTGYVTTPDLSEIKWTSSLINLYNRSIPFLIILMLIIMLFAYVSGILPFQRAVFGLIIFSVFLFTPVTIINNVVGLSNRVSQRIYGERFTYWALVQEESYASAIDNAVDKAQEGNTYDNYLRTLYATNSETYSNQGGDSIVLKWQAPKKMASLMLTEGDNKTLDGLMNSSLLTSVLNRNAMSGQTYMDGKKDYMYRSYTDLANFSRYIYNGINTDNQGSYSEIQVDKDWVANVDKMEDIYKSDIDNGYSSNKDTTKASDNLRIIKPLTSNMYLDAVKNQIGTIKDLKIGEYVGINQDAFNFSVAMFNQSSLNYTDLTEGENAKAGNKDAIKEYYNGYSEPDKEISGLAAYSLMSESPFYYFSWDLYDMGIQPTSTVQGTYKDLLLGEENGGYFYNTKGNGELKDFMDMRSLFTYVIPYLKLGNDVVREWDEVYGINTYKGVPTEEGHQDDPDIKDNPELKRKYWHNLNVARLYEIYTPWVDLMYDCSYAKSETIHVLGEKYVIEDPINPASYPEERPMIFSESEMFDMGLSEADLTEVERRILKCNQSMQERMYDLLNYYNFSDVTLNTAAAVNCTFAFNTTFSQEGILFKNNINLYPQSFEINDFSYDAFLRMILANTIDEDITNNEDFYKTVVDRSNIFVGVMYLIVDALSQWVLPAFKMVFIMAIFISLVLLIIITAFKIDPEQRFIGKLIKGIIIPLGGLLLINIGFSWVISLFLGVGNNAVTQSNIVTIQTGDPMIALLLMGALDIVAVILYFMLVKQVFVDILRNSKVISSFIGGAVGGTFAVAEGALSKGTSGVRNTIKGGRGSSGGVAENGTGSTSSRASRRASIDVSKDKDESSTRINDTKRETMKENSKTKQNKERVKQSADKIDKIINSGSKRMENSIEGKAKRETERSSMNKVQDTGANKKD